MQSTANASTYVHKKSETLAAVLRPSVRHAPTLRSEAAPGTAVA